MKLSTLAPGRFLGDMLLRNWGTKALALVVAVMLFVVTRDEVTRAFNVPLRIVPDTSRVLLTPLPDTIQVQVRGPWTRVNRLQDLDFGSATLDLRAAGPGPLELDRASIVMPKGVVLASIIYDHVDLRFEPVIEHDAAVVATIVGEPADDHAIVRIETDPRSVKVRGGRSIVLGLTQLPTESLDLQGADDDIEAQLSLSRPLSGVAIVGEGSEPMRVHVRVVIDPITHEREYEAPVAELAPELRDRVGIPTTLEVVVRGPMPGFRMLERADIDAPVVADARLEQGKGGDVAVLDLHWSDAVPPDVR
ncbi:MAG TPA: CdaR family protein, partial [Nannocystaceae bacterium]|nr:CdaR family protein [Nannocystaceae bacterium]